MFKFFGELTLCCKTNTLFKDIYRCNTGSAMKAGGHMVLSTGIFHKNKTGIYGPKKDEEKETRIQKTTENQKDYKAGTGNSN